MAGGRSNKAIAEALYVSPNTVKTHVTALLHKLEADSRVQLAVIATQHGPRSCGRQPWSPMATRGRPRGQYGCEGSAERIALWGLDGLGNVLGPDGREEEETAHRTRA